MKAGIVIVAVWMMIGGVFLPRAMASWMPLSLPERARQSDAIVVATITNVQRVANGLYRNVAIAKVEQTLKNIGDTHEKYRGHSKSVQCSKGKG